jgi:hypothetical protein
MEVKQRKIFNFKFEVPRISRGIPGFKIAGFLIFSLQRRGNNRSGFSIFNLKFQILNPPDPRGIPGLK